MYDIGVDGGEQEGDGDMAAETEEVPYECPPRQKYPMLFDDPILLQVLLNNYLHLTLLIRGKHVRFKMKFYKNNNNE